MRKIHTQEDGTILGIAATGTSSQESLMSWVRILEKENSKLRSIPIVISNLSKSFSSNVHEDNSFKTKK